MSRCFAASAGGFARTIGPWGVTLLVVVVGWTSGARQAWAQEAKPEEKPGKVDEKLPKAEDVLDQAIEALGGKAALEKVHNRVTKGTVEIAPPGMKGTLAIYEAAPNKRYTLIELEGGPKEETGTDGQVFWGISANGPRLLEGAERSLAARESVFNNELQWRKLFKKAECVAVENVDDKPCYKVVLTPEEGRPETRYYDCKAHVMLKSEIAVTTPMGEIPIKTKYTDFKKVDGILIPFKADQDAGGIQQMAIRITSITHDADIPADRFAVPAPVKALIEKTKAESKPAASAPSKPEKP